MFMGAFSLTNAAPLFGLISSITACFLAGNGNVKFAVYMMFLACICDVFYNKIVNAGKQKSEKQIVFANRLNEICKIGTFGFAPCFIAFCFGFNGWFDALIYGVYIICVAIRVAHNMTLEATSNGKKVKQNRGILLNTSVYVLTILFLLTTFIPAVATVWFSRVFFIALAIGYILNIKVRRFNFKQSVVILGVELAVLLILLIAGDCKAPEQIDDTAIEDVTGGDISQ